MRIMKWMIKTYTIATISLFLFYIVTSFVEPFILTKIVNLGASTKEIFLLALYKLQQNR